MKELEVHDDHKKFKATNENICENKINLFDKAKRYQNLLDQRHISSFNVISNKNKEVKAEGNPADRRSINVQSSSPLKKTSFANRLIDSKKGIFDPVTERECSFIHPVTLDNSTFIGEATKENDVVLCISNLEIESSKMSKKDGIFHFNTISKLNQSTAMKTIKEDRFSLAGVDNNKHDKSRASKPPEPQGSWWHRNRLRMIWVVFLLVIISFSVVPIIMLYKK